jgi:nicotinamidase-related amidase
MHRYVVSDAVKERLLRRQGKLISHGEIDAARTALVVVDMQNHFVAEGFPAEIPLSREIVPIINRMLSDANATWTNEEHAATLNNFMLFFGDVMTADDAIGRLVRVANRESA